MPPTDPQSGPRKRGRAVPPPEPPPPAIPVWTPEELAAYMASTRGVSHLEIRHDHDCPAVGTGRGCRCQPDQFVYDIHWQLIAEVRG